jgi:hypothetical protein
VDVVLDEERLAHLVHVREDGVLVVGLRCDLFQALGHRFHEECERGETLLPVDEEVDRLLCLAPVALRLLGPLRLGRLLNDDRPEVVLLALRERVEVCPEVVPFGFRPRVVPLVLRDVEYACSG